MPSAIEWTNETWNPVTGCTKVSPGCDHCYMYAMYPRLRGMGVAGYNDAPDIVRCMPERLETPWQWKTPRFVFVNSMSDLFHAAVPLDFITALFKVMADTAPKGHIYQILTKRPGRTVYWWQQNAHCFDQQWPSNVWLGVSVENEKYAPRLTVLERVPAPTRFVSAEPLLGKVDLRSWLQREVLHWVIVGGESGPGARPMDLDWARDLRDQCNAYAVPFFLKQLGGGRNKQGGDRALLDGVLWREKPVAL